MLFLRNYFDQRRICGVSLTKKASVIQVSKDIGVDDFEVVFDCVRGVYRVPTNVGRSKHHRFFKVECFLGMGTA